jgi:hypothetical protein
MAQVYLCNLRETGTNLGPGIEYQMLWTYDSEKKTDRTWFFDSLGETNETTGRWDGKTQAFFWKGGLPDGSMLVAKHHFIDKDTYEWDLQIKDKAGKLLADLYGKHMRQR